MSRAAAVLKIWEEPPGRTRVVEVEPPEREQSSVVWRGHRPCDVRTPVPVVDRQWQRRQVRDAAIKRDGAVANTATPNARIIPAEPRHEVQAVGQPAVVGQAISVLRHGRPDAENGGAVNRLYPRDTLHDETATFAREVAQADPLALRQANYDYQRVQYNTVVSAGYKMLNDILDLEREDIAKIPGITTETADQLMAFLSELTDEESGEESRPRT